MLTVLACWLRLCKAAITTRRASRTPLVHKLRAFIGPCTDCLGTPGKARALATGDPPRGLAHRYLGMQLRESRSSRAGALTSSEGKTTPRALSVRARMARAAAGLRKDARRYYFPAFSAAATALLACAIALLTAP